MLEVDPQKTGEAVDRYLKHDFERYLRLSGKHRTDISSPSMNGMPSGSPGNAQEAKIIEGTYAGQVVNAIVATIQNCSDFDYRKPYKQILVDYYIRGLQNFKIAQKIGYSDRQFDFKKRMAQCEFADRFEYWKIVYHVQDQPCLQIMQRAKNCAKFAD
ncbi:ArpU family phage packaging/lysis transcriptional regulator [Lactobacillus nasalidis]|nr:ArpU family phage packaging/lysis transcriptional regulator [Lactobacillus nasalidis]